MTQNKFVAVAKRAVLAGGKVALAGFQKLDRSQVAIKKRDQELVTKYDIAAERVIRRVILQSFPGAYILGEEKGRSGKKSPYQWAIDPIDGTTNFTIHSPEFGVSVGVLYNGQSIAGAIYIPVTKELFWASKGRGAYLGGRKIKVSGVDSFDRAVIDFEFSHEKNYSVQILPWFEKLTARGIKLRHFGCDTLSLSYLACGRIDATIMSAAKPWDVAAGQLIATEAGAKFTDINGRPVTDLSCPMIAGNVKIHKLLLGSLKR
ncbi:MAG: inositol monophosphatase [Candidatus Komeilibacteria bacterium]